MSRRLVPILLLATASLVAALPAAARPRRVAILPLVVHTVDSSDYLRDGLADMLASRLGRMPGVAVIRVEDGARATTDAAAAAAAGREAGADYVLFGSFTQFGAGASLDLECAPTAASRDRATESRRVFVHAGELGEIIPRLSELTEKVARFVTTGEAETVVLGTGGDPAASSAELDALRRRVDALEQVIEDLRSAAVPEPAFQGSAGPLGAPPGAQPLR